MLGAKTTPGTGGRPLGHRGMHLGYPENSLAAIEAVIHHGLHRVEVDVHTTADDHIVLMHDERVERTTTGSGKGGEMKWREVEQLRFKDSDRNLSKEKSTLTPSNKTK